MFFPRRDFLKTLAWLFGASAVPTAAIAAEKTPAAPSTASIAQQGSAEPPIAAEFDLIVVGGGISGTTAAISAARNGVKVALVHERSMLGGNSSSEVRLYPEGNDAYQPWIRESGIHEEFHLEDRVRNHVRYREGLMNSIWDLVLYEWCIREKNLTLFLNTHMHAVQMAGKNRIRSVRGIQLGTEKTFELNAPLFVDATGDGVLGYRAGADFRWGREGKKEYDESLAPDQPDEKVMGNTLFFRAYDTGKPVPFKRPEWAMEFPTEKDLFSRNHKDLEAGHWWIEIGAPYHPIRDNEETRHENLRALLGVWDHVKNRGDHGAENYALDFVGFWPYKRESRRIIGDAVVDQRQVQDPQLLDDAVAYGAWGIDLHIQGGINARNERPFVPPHNTNFEKLGTLPYGIPLRSLYSRNVENLFMAGRPISASYVAFCSSRVLSTGCICGQAVGVAAGLCKKHRKTPRQVAKDHAKECQQLILRQDGHIPGVANEDPNDLARAAVASASSEAPLEWPEATFPRELNCPRAQLFPVSGDRIDTVSLWLESRRADAFEMQLGLRSAPHVWDFRAKEDIAVAKARVPAGHNGWVEFTLNQKVEPRKLYWVHAPAAPKIFWQSVSVTPGVSHLTPPGTTAAQRLGKTRWEQQGTAYCLALKLTPPSKPYAAANVNTGTHRPDRWPNIWISEPSLPQHVALKWDKPKKFNTVLLTFDTNTGRRENLPLFRYPDCVKDYDVQAMVGGAWRTVASGRENYMRRCEHRFEAVEAEQLRLNVLATNGATMARVYEIRVYDEA
ncbi:MAG: hypothetical protein QOF78_959 [Phycisphaerales bacterium]|jgi:hypothetical protein|nr:hypothetical protein [Phycisphaerales bacterium]